MYIMSYYVSTCTLKPTMHLRKHPVVPTLTSYVNELQRKPCNADMRTDHSAIGLKWMFHGSGCYNIFGDTETRKLLIS